MRRGLSKLVVLAFAVTCVGATCDPTPAMVRVEIRRPLSGGGAGRTWTREVIFDSTHAWMEEGLDPVVAWALTPSKTSLSVSDGTSSGARELFVLSTSTTWDPSLRLRRLDPSTRSAAHRSKTSSSTLIDSVQDIKAARLVDHGGCAWITPWIQGPNTDNLFGPPTTETKGTFRALDDAIEAGFRSKSSGLVVVGKALTAYQPSFTRQDISVHNTIDNDDGFALHEDYTFVGRNNGFGTTQLALVQVSARYAVRQRNGLPFIEIVGSPRVSVAGNLIAWFIKESELSDTFAKQIPDQMNAQILAQASQVPVPFSRCDASRGAGGDATCSNTLNRSLLADVLGTAAKDKPRGAAIVASLKNESFVCRPIADDPTNGQCWWHPFFERVNVLPQGIETVWENAGAPVSPDRQVVQILAPNQDRCDTTSSYDWIRLPTYVPTNWYGEHACGGCIPLP